MQDADPTFSSEQSTRVSFAPRLGALSLHQPPTAAPSPDFASTSDPCEECLRVEFCNSWLRFAA